MDWPQGLEAGAALSYGDGCDQDDFNDSPFNSVFLPTSPLPLTQPSTDNPQIGRFLALQDKTMTSQNLFQPKAVNSSSCSLSNRKAGARATEQQQQRWGFFVEKRLTLQPDMFEKLLENRESIQHHLAIAGVFVDSGAGSSTDTDDDAASSGGGGGNQSTGSSDQLVVQGMASGSSSSDGGGSGASSTVSLTFDEPSKSVVIRGPTEDSLGRACAELKLFMNPPTSSPEAGGGGGGGDQLGLSGLSKLASATSNNQQHHRGLRTAASWDANNYHDFGPYQKGQARRCHSSSDAYNGMVGAANSNVSNSCSASKLRRKLESEDSNYDSDHDRSPFLQQPSMTSPEPILAGVLQGSGQRQQKQLIPASVKAYPVQPVSHGDVSRQTSETLAAEFSEYVTLKTPSGSASVEDDTDLVMDEDYKNKVVFAVRLGYTEAQLQKALKKLGRSAGRNQLLEELIRLQKSNLPSQVAPPTPIAAPSGSVGQLQGSVVAGVGAAGLSGKENGGGGGERLLPIVIDGSNVAMSHGNKDRFSCKGIKICVDWFRARGHTDITVFVPMWRKESSKPDSPITDKHLLADLERDDLLSFTPSRQVLGKRIVCHDDLYILSLAAQNGGVVVSNDNFRELINDKPEFKKVIEEKVLMYSFVKDRFMPPDDPLGKNGPSLTDFLKVKQVKSSQVQTPCPYGIKCTYGNKCKFFHADRALNGPQKSITDTLRDHSNRKMMEICARRTGGGGGGKGDFGTSRDSSPGTADLMRTKSMQPMAVNPAGQLAGGGGGGGQSGNDATKRQLCRAKSSVPRLVDHHHTHSHSLQQHQNAPQHAVHGHPLHIPPPTGPPHGSTHFHQPDQFAQQGAWPSGPTLSLGHKKLQRQLTINPNFDPRIHQHLQQQASVHSPAAAAAPGSGSAAGGGSFNFPPPSAYLDGAAGIDNNPSQPSAGHHHHHHPMLTRNSSAPDRQAAAMAAALAAAGSLPPMNQPPPPMHPHAPQPQQQPSYQTAPPEHMLHKTMSDSFVWGSSTDDQLPIAPPSAPWNKPIGTIGTRPAEQQSRSDLYFHLAAIFPKEAVERAMELMPHETNAQVLCKYILSNQ